MWDRLSHMKSAILLLSLALLALAPPLAAQPQLPYEVVEDWPQIPESIKMGAAMGVAVDAGGHIWLYNRGTHPLIQFDKSGKVLQAWEDGAVMSHAKTAHGMRIAKDGGLWLVGREAETVWKYSPEGRAEVVIGAFGGKPGDNDSEYAFNRPAGAAFDSQGNVYIADGYQNTRVVKYTPDGKYILHWGKPGDGDGEFNLVHDVAIDPQDFVYVADRANERIQVFDQVGRFIKKWEGIGMPWGLVYDPWRKVIWMCDGQNGRVSKLSLDGEVLGVMGENGSGPGQFDQAHNIAVDEEGNLYVCETKNFRIQKFAPKK